MSLGLLSAWSCPFWPGIPSLLMHHLYCSSCPQYRTDCSPRISKSLSETSSSSSSSHSLSFSDRDSVTVVECAGSVISVNDSEPSSAGAAGVFNDEVRMFRHVHTQCHTIARASLHARFWASSLGTPTWWNHLGRVRTRRSHCQSHNSQRFMSVDATRSSRAPPTTLCVPFPPSPSNATSWKKKIGKQMFWKSPCGKKLESHG